MGDHRQLVGYQKAFSLAMDIFQLAKKFPQEEKYSLTDQLKRSSRSVCANIAEAYKRRRYPNYFVSRLSDAQAENTETQVWLDFALECGYLEKSIYDELSRKNDETARLIFYMINNPLKFT